MLSCFLANQVFLFIYVKGLASLYDVGQLWNTGNDKLWIHLWCQTANLQMYLFYSYFIIIVSLFLAYWIFCHPYFSFICINVNQCVRKPIGNKLVAYLGDIDYLILQGLSILFSKSHKEYSQVSNNHTLYPAYFVFYFFLFLNSNPGSYYNSTNLFL